MVRPCFHPDRALKVRSQQQRFTAFTCQATIMGQNRLSVGQRRVFLGKVRVKLICRNPSYHASYKDQPVSPAALALRRGDIVTNDRIERCYYC